MADTEGAKSMEVTSKDRMVSRFVWGIKAKLKYLSEGVPKSYEFFSWPMVEVG
jgi:hypothetical protein